MDRIAAFFCPTEADRERLIELEAILRPPRVVTYVAVAATLAVLIPWIGWWPLAIGAGLGALYELLIRRRLERSAHPALLVVCGFLLNTIAIACGVILSGGPQSPALPWLTIPIISLAGRFDRRGVLCGTAFVTLALAGVAATDPSSFLDNPTRVLAMLPLTISVGMFSAALMRAERYQRRASALDPLTGLLNRSSLEGRFGELAEQARLTGDPVALIAVDVDHFKTINDTHGHARGDVVLRDIAAAIRGQLRAFELAYRLGGEEFLIVLPGVDLEHGVGVAERLRLRVAALQPDGVPVAVSLGVSAGAGEGVSFGPLFEQADGALYAAKRAGRNRVLAASDVAEPVAV